MNKKPGGSKDFGKRGNFSKKPGQGPKRSERPDKPTRPVRGPRPDNSDRPDRSGQSDKPVRKPKPDGRGRPERPARGPKPEHYERPDRPERPARGPRPDHSERPDRSDRPARGPRPDRSERPDRSDRPARGPRPDRSERPERSGDTSRRENSGRPQKTAWKDRPARPTFERPALQDDSEQISAQAEDERLVIKGRHEVVQALESGQTIEAVVISTTVKGPVGGQLRELATARQIPVKEMNPDLFERKFGEKSQGVVALAGAFDYCSLEELVKKVSPGRKVLIALNHVEDPRNLGAIVRTVEASGCGGVIIPKHRAAGMTEWAMRTAQGAASYLPVARVNNMGSALEQLKEMGYWIVGLDSKAEKRYDEVVYSNDVVLVAGGEDAGLGERIQRVCDDLVAIPLCGKTPSLNVSVSTGVVLYEILRQKQFFQK
ncbi:MAG: 23S rRNA (guanosine(2251)-2'-O)-methyltransferase RlmB [Candidatus Riflebacteria bacterium]|nr:23S rRNA (guanosine(2251)-2'-O)-methyltransferase RlmB [Candidatus Riflebacteria bacterium]